MENSRQVRFQFTRRTKVGSREGSSRVAPRNLRLGGHLSEHDRRQWSIPARIEQRSSTTAMSTTRSPASWEPRKQSPPGQYNCCVQEIIVCVVLGRQQL